MLKQLKCVHLLLGSAINLETEKVLVSTFSAPGLGGRGLPLYLRTHFFFLFKLAHVELECL
jgi:hypothetical protein